MTPEPPSDKPESKVEGPAKAVKGQNGYWEVEVAGIAAGGRSCFIKEFAELKARELNKALQPLVSRAALADGIARILHDKETIGARELDLRRWLDEYDSLEGDVT